MKQQQQQQQLLQCKRLRLDAKSTDSKPIKSNFYFYLQSDLVGTRPSKGTHHPHHQHNTYNGRVAVNNNSVTDTRVRNLKLSPITYNFPRYLGNNNNNNTNPNHSHNSNNNNNNNRLLNKRWLSNTDINQRTASLPVKDEKGFLVLSTKRKPSSMIAEKCKPKNNNMEYPEETLPHLLDGKAHKLYQNNKRNEHYDGVQESNNKATNSYQQKKRKELDNEEPTKDNNNNKITEKEDVKILEEATVRSSIRKCESWLQKYF